MSIKNKKIAFILYNYPLSVSTMIINTIELLGYDNEIIVYTNNKDEKNKLCDFWLKNQIKVINTCEFLSERIILSGKIKRLIKKIKKFFKMEESWESKNRDILNFSSSIKKELKKNPKDIVIAIESLSLIVAADIFKNVSIKTSLIYFDMELLDWSLDNPLYLDKLELKKRQFNALQLVDHVFITSFNRADIFSKINNFPRDRISVLPVVPRKRNVNKGSNYFRKKFNIAEDKIIVIYSGNFQPWAQCFEIIQSMISWPNNAVLIMHTWNKNTSEYFKKMLSAAMGLPVYFSTDFLLYTELGDALSSADIGLLFYEAIDDNFTEICFSSNKMGEYIASGLPVICSPFKSLKEFVDENKIGKAVNFDKIGESIAAIIDGIYLYRRNVEVCCEKYFVFDNYFSFAISEYEKKQTIQIAEKT